MLNSIFNLPPAQSNADEAAADTPGSFFAEFLPEALCGGKPLGASGGPRSRQPDASQRADGDALGMFGGAAAAAAGPSSSSSSSGNKQQCSQRVQQAAPAGAASARLQQQQQPQPARQSTTTPAAGAADSFPRAHRASSVEAACNDENSGAAGEPGDGNDRDGDGDDEASSLTSESSDAFDFDDYLPNPGELAAKLTRALFGNPDTDAAIGGGGADGKDGSSTMLDRLALTFGSEALLHRSRLLPAWRQRKPKPLRLKLAEQVLSKEMMRAVAQIDAEILSAPDPLPNATIRFFLRAAEGMGKGWARQHAGRVFLGFGGFVAASCGAFHAAKCAAKWLAWRVPKLGPKAVGPAVSFTADVLLPSAFFGPLLASYVIVKVLVKQQQQQQQQQQQEQQPLRKRRGQAAVAAAAVSTTTTTAGAMRRSSTRSQELQLQLCLQPASGAAAQQRLLRGRSALVRSGSLRAKPWRQRLSPRPSAADAAAAPAGSGGGKSPAAAAAGAGVDTRVAYDLL